MFLGSSVVSTYWSWKAVGKKADTTTLLRIQGLVMREGIQVALHLNLGLVGLRPTARLHPQLSVSTRRSIGAEVFGLGQASRKPAPSTF